MGQNIHNHRVGAWKDKTGNITFTVWAPRAEKVELIIIHPEPGVKPMERLRYGYWKAVIENAPENIDYYYRLNGETDRPDPASQFQPLGVHQVSRVINHHSFNWEDGDWKNIPLDKMIIYELHVGTFTPEGTFDGVINKLDYLKKLGINAISIMPVSQFPGERNWGYDGVHPYSVQNSYGGPDKLKNLVNIAHKKGIAVILDLVYNHLGPEGNYLHEFAPYFTEKYKTPWGWAVNYDDTDSDGVRNYFIRNALYWFDQYHIDALRLDAIHGIYDFSAKPFLREMAEEKEKLSNEKNRPFYLIAETNQNDIRIINSLDKSGYGMDSQWSDDFHHSVHTLLTNENEGYYKDYGLLSDLEKSIREGFAYDWRYSEFRKRRHGSSSKDLPGHKFIISIQTHDQVGNRLLGERLTSLVSFEALKTAAVTMLMAPYVPMLFMGEEHAEKALFLYFISHNDPDLVQAVREGRKKEFESFKWETEPPDPQSTETFNKSKINWSLQKNDKHKTMLELYKKLIDLRKSHHALNNCDKTNMTVQGDEERKLLAFSRKDNNVTFNIILNYSDTTNQTMGFESYTKGELIIDTADNRWKGTGSSTTESASHGTIIDLKPYSAVIFRHEN